ncbi:hypothetical protein R1sor_014871 [Riccia sorocarpa]|uniref:Uncharacterized protein n=1 Tax=Riccia sorocarpa TaxID=122646 RepID=A0ABD3HAM2_9MARC
MRTTPTVARIGNVSLLRDGFSVHRSCVSLKRCERREIQNAEKALKRVGVLDEDDRIEGVYVETGFDDPLDEILDVGRKLVAIGSEEEVHVNVQIHSRELYSAIESLVENEAHVNTRYKMVDKKMKPVAQPLPSNAKIGCVDPNVVAPMVVFTVPHAPWDLRPIPVPRALLPKLMELLKEKMKMKILEPSFAPYSSRWFTVPKKNGALHFIQDMQPVNQVTIRNTGIGPIVESLLKHLLGEPSIQLVIFIRGMTNFNLQRTAAT